VFGPLRTFWNGNRGTPGTTLLAEIPSIFCWGIREQGFQGPD
jgi:hypothetical protein